MTARPRTRRARTTVARVAIAALVLAVAGAAGTVAAPPAHAAAAPPALRVVAGDRLVTAAWKAVPGATSYDVRLATTPTLRDPRTVRTHKRFLRFRRLTDGRPYFVTITAVGHRVRPAAATSRVVKATPTPAAPRPVKKVRVVSGARENQVVVSWKGGGRASKVAVVAGSSVLTNIRPFHSPWRPATTRSITLTVPEALRPYIGAGSGDPVWVRVVQSNGPSTAFGASSSTARRYLLSTPGTWAFAKAVVPSVAVDKLTVAELNVQSVGSTQTFHPRNQWAARAPRVAKAIDALSPSLDLLFTAELATNKLDDCHGTTAAPYNCRDHTQVADLARRLPKLTLADADAFDRVHDRMSLASEWGSRVTSGAHVFYDADRLTLLDHGFYSPAMARSDRSIPGVEGLGVTPWDPTGPVSADRWLSWAELQVKSSGRRFYAVAAHYPVGDQRVVVRARALETKRLIAAIQKRAGDLPIVFGGDVNSDAVRSAEPVTPLFIAAGWFDAAAVRAKHLRTGMDVSTANGSGPQDGLDPGYGSRPVVHPYPTSRIDYILLRNSPHTYRYANVLRVDAKGAFIKALQGTDHNAQLATIGIAGPVAP